jgi:WD40 repeat protein
MQKSSKRSNLETTKRAAQHLNLKQTYGVKLIDKGLEFVSSTEIVFVSGCNFTLMDIENGNMRFIQSKCDGQLTKFIVLADKKRIVYVSNVSNGCSIVALDLFETRTEAAKNEYKTVKKPIVTLCASHDCKYLVFQTGFPDWSLFLLNCKDLSPITELKTINTDFNKDQTVTDLTFFPHDSKKILVTGKYLIKVYLINRNAIKLAHLIQTPLDIVYVSHAWYNKTEVLVIDFDGSVHAIDVKQNCTKQLFTKHSILSTSENDTEAMSTRAHSPTINEKFDPDLKSISSQYVIKNDYSKLNGLVVKPNDRIVCINIGFLYYGSTDEIFCYKRCGDFKYIFLFSVKLHEDQQQPVHTTTIDNLCVNQSQTSLVICTNQKSIFTCELLPMAEHVHALKLVNGLFHNDIVTCIDACKQKPWVVVCSLDKWLNIWNYETFTVEIRKTYDEKLLDVRFHPTGLYLILCSINSIKLMSIHLKDLKVKHEYNVRSCYQCVFSNGGHKFACVHSTLVQIFSTVSHLELCTIKAQQVGKIKNIAFTNRDRYIICCSTSGGIHAWDIQSQASVFEISNKGLNLSGFAMSPNNNTIFVISSDKTIKLYKLNYSNDKMVCTIELSRLQK